MAKPLIGALAPLLVPALMTPGDARLDQVAALGAKLDNPIVAILGPSTTYRNQVESSHIIYNLTSGPHVWARTLDPRVRFVVWYDASDGQGRNYRGSNYGKDSVGGVSSIDTNIAQIASIKASKCGIVVWNTGRSADDVFNGQTLAGYCDRVKTNLLDLKSSGKIVIWENLWNRHTSVGGDWASGGACRTLVAQINAEMTAWCAANGIIVADVYTVMTDSQDADKNPKANYYTSDGIHYSAAGAYQAGKYYAGLYARFTKPAVIYDGADAANILSVNKSFANAGGVANGLGASGVAPDSWTLSRGNSGNARSCVGAIDTTTLAGKRGMKISIGSSGAVAAAGEGITFRPTTIPIVGQLSTSKYYVGRIKCLVGGAWNGLTGVKLIAQDANATPNGSADLTPGSGVGGNTPVTGFTATDQYAIRQDGQEWWYLETQPFLGGQADCTFRINLNYINATGGLDLTFFDPDLREVADPSTLI